MKDIKKYLFRILFVISIIVNIILGFNLLINKFNSPPERTGVLTRNLEIGLFGDKDKIFMLPKGLTVKDSSPRGFDAIDRFEPNRFSITVSTDKEDLVDYSIDAKKHEDGSLYSADLDSDGKFAR